MEIIKQMKLLVNDKELAKYLISLIDLKEICSQHKIQSINVQEAINFIIQKKITINLISINLEINSKKNCIEAI